MRRQAARQTLTQVLQEPRNKDMSETSDEKSQVPEISDVRPNVFLPDTPLPETDRVAILHSELADQYAALHRISFRTLTDLAALQRGGDPPDWAEVGDRLTRHGHRRAWETMRSQLATLLDIHVGAGPVAALPEAYRRKAVDPAFRRLDGLRFRARRRLDRFVGEPTTALEVLRPGWWKRRWDEIAALRR